MDVLISVEPIITTRLHTFDVILLSPHLREKFRINIHRSNHLDTLSAFEMLRARKYKRYANAGCHQS